MKRAYFVLFLYSVCLHPVLFGVGEKTISIGASSGWEVMERRSGVTEASLARPHPVLVLDSAANIGALGDYSFNLIDSIEFIEPAVDLALSFDEGDALRFADAKGRYLAVVSPGLFRSGQPWTRAGEGAARFAGPVSGSGAGAPAEGPLVLRPKGEALFGAGKTIGDFSIEFWLFPMNMENGEQVLTWTSSKPGGRGASIAQRIECEAVKNRLQWTFLDLFSNADGTGGKTISLTGSVVLPRTWSHHLIRFNADLGLLEYLVDGRLEALEYTTSSGREGGDVYVPVIGEGGRFVLGGRLAGIIDEFRIYSLYLESPKLVKYPPEGGKVESRTLDLGGGRSQILKIEALGGRISDSPNSRFLPENTYAGNTSLRFADHSEIQFFIRANDTPYRWNSIPWVPVEPGADLSENLSGGDLSGRYIQVAAAFYPSGDGEITPYLDELRISYRTAEPPRPPTQLSAIARDGAVELSWRASPGRDVGGYLIYYGTSSGEYFGDHGILGDTVAAVLPAVSSPVNVGNRTAVRIEGLKNGTLYYFAAAAYSAEDGGHPEPGVFSREAAARPLPEAPLSSRAEVSRKVE